MIIERIPERETIGSTRHDAANPYGGDTASPVGAAPYQSWGSYDRMDPTIRVTDPCIPCCLNLTFTL